MYKHILIFKRKSSGSILRIETIEKTDRPFSFVEGFDGFEITEELIYKDKCSANEV